MSHSYRTHPNRVPGRGWSSLLLSVFTMAILSVSVFGHSDAKAVPSTSPDGVTVVPGDGGLPLMEQLSSVNNLTLVSTPKHLADVGSKGDMSHSIPIVIPPGLLKPVLSHDYAAGAKTSLDMGYYGWNLGGVMGIQPASEAAFKQGVKVYRISDP